MFCAAFAILNLTSALLAPQTAHADFQNESEAGVVITSGNTRTQSLSIKQMDRYSWLKNAFALNGSFLQTKNAGVLSAKRWDLQLRYERQMNENLSLILAQGVQSDRFAGYLQRLNSDFGPRYVILRDQELLEWAAELTYRFSREIKTTGQRDYRQQGRFFTEVKRNWSPTTSSRFWIEFIPSFRRFDDWELRSEISTTAALTAIFSMKAGYQFKYDNVPATTTALKRDSEFTTALVAKF